MNKILRGVCCFHRETYPRRRALYRRLAKGQRPQACFITCADSRIDPLSLTTCDPGDLFVIRNAGNLVPTPQSSNNSEAAAIEVALSVGIRDIIICGHSHCGAMQELLNPTGSSIVHEWLRNAGDTRRRVAAMSGLTPAERLWAAVQTNVQVQLQQLGSLPMIAERVQAGELHLHGWVYRIETGEVMAYDHQCDAFSPIRTCESMLA